MSSLHPNEGVLGDDLGKSSVQLAGTGAVIDKGVPRGRVGLA